MRSNPLRLLEVETLRECELIVAEDTRVARRLLAALGLPSKPLWSYREQNAESATPAILDRARSAAVAVVTDAGMPAISDPGRDLIAAARAAGIAIEVKKEPADGFWDNVWLKGPCVTSYWGGRAAATQMRYRWVVRREVSPCQMALSAARWSASAPR